MIQLSLIILIIQKLLIDYKNNVLNNFFDENASFDSISSISAVTGIAPSSVQRFMISNNYIDTNVESSGFSPIQY